MKRRRLTSESLGGAPIRHESDVEAYTPLYTEENSVIGEDLEVALRNHLATWTQKLILLQPKVCLTCRSVD